MKSIIIKELSQNALTVVMKFKEEAKVAKEELAPVKDTNTSLLKNKYINFSTFSNKSGHSFINRTNY